MFNYTKSKILKKVSWIASETAEATSILRAQFVYGRDNVSVIHYTGRSPISIPTYKSKSTTSVYNKIKEASFKMWLHTVMYLNGLHYPTICYNAVAISAIS
jgi:hypothetical protein